MILRHPKAYYNEFDPFAAAWIKELITRGHIAHGDVDERSITDVTVEDLAGYTQHHFFAGIGAWSYALRKAGWADDRPVWTGSPPCQPFSAAGKRQGFNDERHLWPIYYELIKRRHPRCIFGEQVSSAEVVGKVKGDDRRVWFDAVQSDLERALYAVAPFDLPAAGFGAPHIRQRLFFVAERLADNRLQQRQGTTTSGNEAPGRVETTATVTGFHCNSDPSQTNGRWRDADWLRCGDDKWRPVEPGTFPLAHGSAARVGRLRGYGNAIVAPVAIEFIRAYMQCN